jgi:hypothetical protein
MEAGGGAPLGATKSVTLSAICIRVSWRAVCLYPARGFKPCVERSCVADELHLLCKVNLSIPVAAAAPARLRTPFYSL